MLKWIALVVAAILVRIVWVQVRHVRPARRRLDAFLAAHGVRVASVRVGARYGWPAYDIQFPSDAERDAFRHSPLYSALIDEVQGMHLGFTRGGRAFDARAALILWVQPRPTSASPQTPSA